MFFDLSNIRKENFPFVYYLSNGLILNTDDGWTNDGDVISKGYPAIFVNLLFITIVSVYCMTMIGLSLFGMTLRL